MLKNTLNNRGFTLYEIVISLVVISLMMGFVLSMIQESTEGVSRSYETMDYVEDVRYLEELVYNDLKYYKNVVYYKSNEITSRVEFFEGDRYIYVSLDGDHVIKIESNDGVRLVENFRDYDVSMNVRDRLFIFSFVDGEKNSYEIKIDLGVANIESR